MQTDEVIYKVMDAALVRQSRETGRLAPMPVDLADGFVHFSTVAQLPETLRLHFAGRGDLVLLAVRTGHFGGALRYEPSRGGQLFPHVHGEVPMSEVVAEAAITVDAEGNAALPEWAR